MRTDSRDPRQLQISHLPKLRHQLVCFMLLSVEPKNWFAITHPLMQGHFLYQTLTRGSSPMKPGVPVDTGVRQAVEHRVPAPEILKSTNWCNSMGTSTNEKHRPELWAHIWNPNSERTLVLLKPSDERFPGKKQTSSHCKRSIYQMPYPKTNKPLLKQKKSFTLIWFEHNLKDPIPMPAHDEGYRLVVYWPARNILIQNITEDFPELYIYPHPAARRVEKVHTHVHTYRQIQRVILTAETVACLSLSPPNTNQYFVV